MLFIFVGLAIIGFIFMIIDPKSFRNWLLPYDNKLINTSRKPSLNKEQMDNLVATKDMIRKLESQIKQMRLNYENLSEKERIELRYFEKELYELKKDIKEMEKVLK